MKHFVSQQQKKKREQKKIGVEARREFGIQNNTLQNQEMVGLFSTPC